MIAIKNIKMPSSCYDCPFAKNKKTNDYGSFCECGALEDYETINLLEHSKHPNCPLVEQEPDLDKIRAEIEELKNKIRKEHNYGADAVYGSHVIHGINAVLEIFDKYKAESED